MADDEVEAVNTSAEMAIANHGGLYAFGPRAAINACGMLSNRRAAKVHHKHTHSQVGTKKMLTTNSHSKQHGHRPFLL